MVDEEHGGAGFGAFGDGVVEGVAGGGVEPGPGLVEDEQLRLREQGRGHRHLLAAALGQLGEG